VPRDAWAWRFDPKSCGGGPLVFDDGHHKFSLAWYFMGGIAEEVHAWIGQLPATWGEQAGFLDAPAIVSWKFSNNRFGSLEAVYSPEMVVDTIYYAQDDRIEITGTKGVIWVTRGHGKMMDIPPVILYKDQKVTNFSDVETDWKYSFIHSTRHFIDAYFKGAPPCLTGEQGREILRFALAAQESARTGQSVKL
jgi:predicted dehydrogenase